MHRSSITQITYLGIFIGIIILMTFTPNLGYITTGIFSVVTIHVPVIIGSALLGPLGGLVLGSTWGITSYLYALTQGTVEGAIFLNPLVSIVPRILVGLIIAYSAIGLKNLIKNDMLRHGLVAAIGTLSNTVLVLSAIFLFESAGLISFNQGLRSIIAIVLSVNGLSEIALAVILVPIVLRALSRVKTK